jgi:hypothetical protein
MKKMKKIRKDEKINDLMSRWEKCYDEKKNHKSVWQIKRSRSGDR